MAHRFKTTILVTCLLISPFLLAAIATADTIALQNGDRLSGTIIRKENNELTFNTSYAKDIVIKWDEIATFSTAAKIILYVEPGEVLEGSITMSEPGTVMMGETGTIIRLDTIRSINPPPHIIGRGHQWKGTINSAMTKTDGNTNTENLHTDAETVLRTRNSRYTLGAVYNRAEDNGVETEANIKGYTKTDRFFSRKWYALANASGEKDHYQDLDLRFTAGFGVGYQAKETPKENLGLESGIAYVREVFVVAENEEFPAFRWATKYDRFLMNNLLQFFHAHELLVGLDYGENILVRSKTGFKVPATKKLYVSLQINFDWNNTPADSKKKTDTTYLLGLGWTL